MIFQDADAILTAIYYIIILVLVIAFLLNIIVLRKRASKKFDSKRMGPPIFISLIWAAIGIGVYLYFPEYGIIALFANIIIGAILVKIFYHKGFGKSLGFVIVVQIIVFIYLVIIIVFLVLILVFLVM